MATIRQDVVLGGRYRLVEHIASGGMGTVWRGEDLVLHRPVAVKLLSEALGQDERFVERFRREARAAAGLSHPNVAEVFDYGEDQDTPFIVMELLPGETLADRLQREGRLPPGDAERIAVQVADALQAAHDAGIVHRDVKPGNVMLAPGGGVKVMDFGVAAAAWAAPLTSTGTTIGTASYLSPEQAAGERATPASDVYALGCVLYEMLTGRPPFVGESPLAVAGAHVREMPVPVRQVVPEVPEHLASACDQALMKDPTARPGSAGMLAAMLEMGAGPAAATQVLGPAAPTTRLPSAGLAATTPDTPVPWPSAPPTGSEGRDGPRHRSGARRSRAALWAIVAMLVAAAVAVGLVLTLAGDGTPASNSPAGPTSPSSSASVTVPSVVGLGFRDAAAKIRDAGLVPRGRPVQGEFGLVLGVNPPQGTSVQRGDSVTLFVGNGHKPQKKKHDEGNGLQNGGD